MGKVYFSGKWQRVWCMVCFASLTLFNYGNNCGVMVIYMNPVANLFASTVQSRFSSFKNLCYLPGNKLFYMLVWPVIVWTIWNCCTNIKTSSPGADQHVRAGFRARVRAWRIIASKFTKLGRIVKFKVAIDFVSRYVVKMFVVLADGFKNLIGANNISLNKRPWATMKLWKRY